MVVGLLVALVALQATGLLVALVALQATGLLVALVALGLAPVRPLVRVPVPAPVLALLQRRIWPHCRPSWLR